MEFSGSSPSLSALLCPEDGRMLAFSDDEVADDELLTFCDCSVVSQSEDEYVEALVSKETIFSSETHNTSTFQEDFSSPERMESVRWILKMKSFFRFSSRTAYLAVTYLDRFLLRRTANEGKTWPMKLLSIACLSLAAKKEERRQPFLSEYQFQGYSFSGKAIQAMELFVLNELDWRLESVTPFAYLGYFASKLRFGCRSETLIAQAVGFLFAIVEAMDSISFRPSTLAAAAILAASGYESGKKMMESKSSEISLPEPSEIENVFTCYNAMIRESQEKIRSQLVFDSLDVLTNYEDIAEMEDFTDISFFNPAGKSRRRL